MASHRDRLLALLRQRPILRPRDLHEHQIPRSYLARLMADGLLFRSGRGIYVAADAELSELQSLAEIAQRIPHGVICLLSALRFHELTTESPHEVWVAVPRTARLPRVDYPAIRAVRFSDAAFQFGIQPHQLGSITLRIYSPAKTVADCFKYRHKIGIDVATQALRDLWRQRLTTMDELWTAAQVCRMSNVMRPYLESLS